MKRETFVVKGREIVVQTDICMHIKNQIDKMAISHINLINYKGSSSMASNQRAYNANSKSAARR
jgi:hypothetical protein